MPCKMWGVAYMDWFVQHIPQMLSHIEICGILSPIQHPKQFLKPFWNNICSVAGNIILLIKTNAIKEYKYSKEVYLVCNNI